MEPLSASSVLGPDDPPPVEIVNAESTSPLLIHCDHGGNAVPARLNGLGLSPETLEWHVAWDIGAAAVARGLANRMGAAAVLARYSRLVIDANRAWGDPDVVPTVSDGRAVPGNQGLASADVMARATAISAPYHQAIDMQIARLTRAGRVPIVLSVHSFTPALMNRTLAKPRPWHVGVMFSRDERLARVLAAALRARRGLIVGENQPYSGVTHGYCLKLHGLAQGLPHAQIEIRQDLVCTAAGQARWADLLADVLGPILGHEDLQEIMHL
jgi:predicted N-formylglutamate amidohydrolase